MSERGSCRFHRGGWEIRVQVHGTRYSERVPGENNRQGRRDAEAALDALIRRADANFDGLTVADVIEKYAQTRSGDWSPTTQKSHPWHAAPIIEAIGAVPVSDLKRSQLQDVYDQWRSDGASPGTIRRRHSVLGPALHYAVDRGWILRSPAERLTLPTVPRNLMDLPSQREIEAAITMLPPEQRRLQVVARLGLACGARRGELAGLRWSDVNFDDGTVLIQASLAEGPKGVLTRKSTKSGSVRVVDIDPESMSDLRRWKTESSQRALELGVGQGDSHPVFGSPTDPTIPVRPSRIGQDWHRWRSKIGLGKLRLHDLRHRYATTLLEQGVPVHHVSQRLGHSTPVTTLRIYAHAIPLGDRAGADAISAARQVI